MNKVSIIAAMHGDEVYGIELYNAFVKRYPDKANKVKIIIGNEKAHQQNVRFIDADMNRQYSAAGSSHERQEIARVDAALKAFGPDYIIDIHTTKRDSGIFFISDKPNRVRQRIYDMLDIDVCIMKDVVIRQSLIGAYENAVSLEYSLRSISQETTSSFVDALFGLVYDSSIERNNRRKYVATRLISKDEWEKYKGLKSYEQKPEGISLMVPADISEMNATYFGFWCEKL